MISRVDKVLKALAIAWPLDPLPSLRFKVIHNDRLVRSTLDLVLPNRKHDSPVIGGTG